MVNQPDDPNQAQAWISGTPPDQTIDFYIPRGNTGPRGPIGPIGPSLAVGSVATVTGPAAPGTIGATGLTGPKGDPGGFTTGTVLTGTTDLNNISAAGIYFAGVGVASTALNYPALSGSAGGDLIVYERGANSTANGFQEFWPTSSTSNGNVFYRRTKVNSVWSPWRSFTGTRVDQTAGRTIYQWDDLNNREQLIYGNTGLRDITTLLAGGAGNLYYQREGNTVHVIGRGITGADPTTGVAIILAGGQLNGCYPATTVRTMAPNFAKGWEYLELLTSGEIRMYVATTPTNSLSFQFSYPTANPWPTILYGTASGSIPV
ncbi:hypothetical protein SEA_DEVITOJR_22 [Arthrobacter phage DevitoJr]|uniref:Minor tail protein n=1 Tax=Arthrobacter phage DevitoJr TaxID=2859477 RepID=A0AAE7SSQ3_9CAUD|nr:hypothetical protein QCN40_gp22 [Arthrobacter phage DevitoJr]QXO13182.1 hypothetical protein SEA_DEVITOJR_22 [Arthrobacter phage DevitoJr]